MFTGIIKEIGKVAGIKQLDNGREMAISCDIAQHVQVDQSISIDGVCHTVTEAQNSSFRVQTVKETLRKTTIGDLEKDNSVNLEPSLRADQPMDGHVVQGHVDSTGTIESIKEDGSDRVFSVSFPDRFKDQIVPRGSITLNGISLTVANVEDTCFKAAIIPYTFHHTTMKNLNTGARVNLEFDILGKYVVNWMNQHH